MDRLNQWLMLFANLGVIAGIVFLGFEIQVNTSALRSANYAAYNEVASSWADFVAEHAAHMPEFGEQPTALDELTPEKRWGRMGFAVKSITQAETIYLNHRAGSLDDDIFDARMDSFQRVLIEMPIMMAMFKDGVGGNVSDFQEYMEQRINSSHQGEPT